MSLSVVKIPRGRQEYIDASWDVKEEIRLEQGLLNQNERFFYDTFLYGDSYIGLNDKNEVAGFGIIIKDSYLALLGVKPSEQGRGFGRKIMQAIIEDYNVITCHTRVTNNRAIEFYKDLGFKIDEIETEYYKNNDDATVMKFEDHNG